MTSSSLSGLNSLRHIGKLNLFRNDELLNLTGLDALTSIGGDVDISYNQKLENLTGLGSLATIGNNLSINHNQSLTSLTGPELLTSIGGTLLIQFNDTLSGCVVMSVCNHIASGSPYDIGANSNGCRTADEVIETCTTAVNDPDKEKNILLYPNPTSGKIDFTGIESDHFKINMTDIQGKVQSNYTIYENKIDISGLPDGIYFISIQTQNQRIIKRAVKSFCR